MRIPVHRVASAFKMGAAAKRDSDVPVRVSVFVDDSAGALIIDTVRTALVPATTSAIVRVERLRGADGTVAAVKADTDISLVLTGGSPGLQDAVQRIAIGGAPTAVVVESSAEAPFIGEETPMLGLIAATSGARLLEALAHWILERTEKGTAFAAAFPFMRGVVADEVIADTSLANALTGALVFVPGADYPMMTLAQLGMMVQLALVYGKPLKLERGYEAAGIALSGLVLRALVRRMAKPLGGGAFVVKALAGGLGTYAMGRVLEALYKRDVDYSRVNGAVLAAVRGGRGAVAAAVDTVPPVRGGVAADAGQVA